MITGDFQKDNLVICRGLVGVGGINHYPQTSLGPILYETICGVDLKTVKIW